MSSLPVLIDANPAADTAPDPTLFSRERQTTFLAALAATGQLRSASARAGVSHQTAYRARLASPGFRRAWDAALLAARAQAEEVLACRALEGWEEDVLYHGEVVATRRRYSDRLLLAHLARLDRLCGDAEVAEFADTFDDNLARYAADEDRPAKVVDDSPSTGSGRAGEGDGSGGNFSSSGQWSKRSTEPEPEPCPECGGRCLGPVRALTSDDCQWLGNRLDRMDAARPAGVREPYQFPGGDTWGAIEAEQLSAFEQEAAEWWWVIPPPEGADRTVWHYLPEDER